MFTDQEKQVVNETEAKPKVKIDGLDIEVDETILKDEADGKPEEKEEPDSKAEPTGEPSPKTGELPDEFVQRYKGKSNDELLTTLYESQKQIGKLGSQLGDKRKTDNPLETIKKAKSDAENELEKLNEKIKDDFDEEYDKESDDYKKLDKRRQQLNKRLTEYKQQEEEARIEDVINKKMYASHNKEFLANQRKVLAESLGVEEFKDELWEDIEAYAQEFAGTGEKVSEEDVHAGTMKVLGYKNYNKIVTSMAKQNVREDIAKASGKTVADVSSKGSGALKLEDMSQPQIEKLLDHLYANDYQGFLKVKERIESM